MHLVSDEVLATMSRFDGNMVCVCVFFFFFYCTHRIDSTFEIRLNYTHRTCDIRRCGLCVAGMSECELISYHLDIYVNFEWQMFEMLYGMLSKWLKGETKHFNLFETNERARQKKQHRIK